ncbi:Hypothetical protein, putative [Bodo saltans]|uniref:Uncharacterized protein n=1 Tax=Bodo saltans TaxID=75058 RepID=A0A0S4JM28_BODSA|nr:Hypothetical protein, putative [Bodo saltans]|eukprot:CUG90333.1 Hypothetical protein, putative [Bodo saltans]
MPFINFDASATTLIDAHLSLSFTQLTDLLKVLIDQTNAHEQRLQDMGSHINSLQRRNEELEKQLQQKTGSNNTALIEELATNVELLRDEIHTLKKKSQSSDSLAADLENLARTVAADRQSTSVAFSTVQEKWSALHQNMNKCQTDVASALAFQDVWGANTDEVNRLVRDQATLPSAKKDYILSLPAMENVLQEIAGFAAAKPSQPGDFVRLADWDAVLKPLLDEVEKLRRQLDDAHRVHRLAEGLDARLREIDEKLRILDATKADHFSLTGKTDKDTTANIAQKISALADELGELNERLNNGGGNGTTAATGGDAIRKSIAAAGGVSDDLRKRVTALETETVVLETKKADRSELMKLYEAMDALTRNSPLGLQSMPSGVENTTSPQPPRVKPPSAKSRSNSVLDQVAVVDSHLPPVDFTTIGSNRMGSASPRRTGSATPSRPLFVGRTAVGVRDSSGGMTPASITSMTR